MFIDSDMMFPHWGIDRLVDRNFDIVGGLYFGRKVPRPIALNIDPRDRKPKVIGKIESKTEPFQVSIVGTGFMLINMNVFKKVDPPFFYHEKPTEFGLAELPFPHNELGEDMVFCLKAQEKGFKVWVDPTIPLGHIGEHVYNEVDYHLFDDESTRYIYEPEERIK